MAKFVIAGSCDCPYFAKLELLACQLSINLPNFEVHKIILPAEDWQSWLQETCEKHGWTHKKSPIVWRELVERGGKGKLMGGFNEFMEYAQCYYASASSMLTDLMMKIKDENIETNIQTNKSNEYFKSLVKPLHFCIVNATNPTAYHLIPHIAGGKVFGPELDVSIRLFDSEEYLSQLQGVVMETIDMAFPHLRNIEICTNISEAFNGASVVVILEDETLPEEEESRDEALRQNAERFENFARVLDEFALPDTKVVVTGRGPINFSTYILAEKSNKINKENIVASSRIQDRRARAILSRRLNVNSNNIRDVIIWGNCADDAPVNSSLVGTARGRVHEYDGAIWGPEWFSRPLEEMVYDNKWLSSSFVLDHMNHDRLLQSNLKHRATMSEAAALVDLLVDWIAGTSPNEITSLGVKCEGSYDISNCVFSLPVKFSHGSYEVVPEEEVKLDNEMKQKLRKMEAQLKRDLCVIFPSLQPDDKPAFGEDSELITSMTSQKELPQKTISGLTVIKEEEAPDDPPAEAENPPEDEVAIQQEN